MDVEDFFKYSKFQVGKSNFRSLGVFDISENPYMVLKNRCIYCMGFLGQVSNVAVQMSTINPRTQVSSANDELTNGEQQPFYLVLGGELAHTLAIFDGV
jgi:hypothetical protein